jgi:hypothetical protein
MSRHIFFPVVLQQWDEFSPYAVAARDAAVALAHGSGALGVDLLVIGPHSQRSFLDVSWAGRRPLSAATPPVSS